MSSPLGAKLAQLANAKKQAAEQSNPTAENHEKIVAERKAAHLSALRLLLEPHVTAFNEMADSSLHIALEIVSSSIVLKQSWVPLLTIDLTERAAIFRRKGGEYTSDDYFTIGHTAGGAMDFRRYSVEVEKPFDGNQFAEFILMEALGLNP